MSNPWIRTHTGLRVDLLDPQPDQIAIADIAHHLAQLNRFCGAAKHPYSVAEHSIRMAWTCGDDSRLALACLLHDAHEAYMGDISGPMKRTLGRQTHERQVAFQNVIETTLLGEPFDRAIRTEVDRIDSFALRIEAEDLMPPEGLEEWVSLIPVPEVFRDAFHGGSEYGFGFTHARYSFRRSYENLKAQPTGGAAA